MAKPMSKRVKAMHKRYVPANIVIIVVALIAGICMLLMPWFDVRIHIEGKGVAKLLTQATTSENSGSESSSASATATAATAVTTATAADAADQATSAVMKELSKALEKETFDIPIRMKPMDMLNFANATGTVEERAELLGVLVNNMIGEDGAAVFLSDFVNKLTPVVMKTTINVALDTAINEAIKESGVQLTPEQEAQIETYKEDAGELIDKLVALDGSDETQRNEVKKDFGDLVTKIAQEQGGDDVEIPEEEINEVFDMLIDQGINPETGKFDVTYLLGNIDLESFENLGEDESSSSGDSSSGDSSVSTVAFQMPVNTDSSSDSDSSDSSSSSATENPLTEILNILQDPSKLLIDALTESGALDEETIATVQSVFLILFIVVVGLPAFCWFHLAVAAALRIVMKKKRVGMWYAKLFGFFSAFFIVLFNVFTANMGSMVSSMGGGSADAMIGTIFEAFSIKFLGSGVVTAICYAILVLGGWFYYKPLKRKIKKMMKQDRKLAKVNPNYYVEEAREFEAVEAQKAEERAAAKAEAARLAAEKAAAKAEAEEQERAAVENLPADETPADDQE